MTLSYRCVQLPSSEQANLCPPSTANSDYFGSPREPPRGRAVIETRLRVVSARHDATGRFSAAPIHGLGLPVARISLSATSPLSTMTPDRRRARIPSDFGSLVTGRGGSQNSEPSLDYDLPPVEGCRMFACLAQSTIGRWTESVTDSEFSAATDTHARFATSSFVIARLFSSIRDARPRHPARQQRLSPLSERV